MKYNKNKSSESVPMKTVSSPEIKNTISVTTSQRNNGGISNPGSTMPTPRHSLKHGEGKYIPNTMDPDGKDSGIDSNDEGC